ncbi:TetR/AcrR family transcriptional regulator [Streptomyces brasiliensis]|uniref:TetR family transcriptional regulator n=1 Tax=Streptomyces brasiliensis TaxID=1954 RepID=A0A917L4Q6_9ACTN|nr:TetR/AcrR family transcriptional regulator [Streptomyces brasiliensis]GGJ44601.1 TetR family transcriptional regulator [Streptomyces brasiliensis]
MGTTPSPPSQPPASPRRTELLDACYAYLLEHGLLGLSLRPLAAATGTSPRVLLYLFGSKDGLLRELLARARHEQLTQMARALDEPGTDSPGAPDGSDSPLTPAGPAASKGPAALDEPGTDTAGLGHGPAVPVGFDALSARLWAFLSAPEQRPMVRLTYEAFLLSLSHDPGPWSGFAAEAAHDWLALLVGAQPPGTPHAVAEARATRTLALVRGLLLDLLACEEPERVTAALTLAETDTQADPT